MIRKCFSVLAAAVIIFSTALAEPDINFCVQNHNLYSGITSAEEISGEPKIDIDAKGTRRYTFRATDAVQVIFSGKDEITGCNCVCLSDSETDEFLAQCVTICYAFSGEDSAVGCYGDILYQFLLARSGKETEMFYITPGIAFRIGKASYGYYFMLTKAV